MRALLGYWRRVTGLYGRGRLDRELKAEIDSHLDLHIADNIREGMTPEQARRAALLHFGSMETIKEEYRDRRGVPAVETLVQDLRFGARTLRKRPAFTAIAVLTLAFGIGGATSIFSVLKAVVLEPLGYRDPSRLYVVHEVIPQVRDRYPLVPVQARHFHAWQGLWKGQSGLAAVDYQERSLTGIGEAERVGCARFTAGMFDLLGVWPAVGTAFTEEDERRGRDDMVLLSHNFWQRRFAGDSGVVGKTIRLDGKVYSIAGVMPRSFRFPSINELNPIPREIPSPEIFQPLIFSKEDLATIAGSFNYFAVARLATGVTVPQALAQLNSIQESLAKETAGRMSLEASLTPLKSYAIRDVGSGLRLLMFAVTAVLVMICANLAHLLLAQGAARKRELAIRAALGVSRGRLLRQLLTESALLAGIGGTLGVLVAFGGVELIRRSAPADVPRMDQVQLDPMVLLFAVGASVATGILFGLLPAWRLHGTDPILAMRAGSRSSTSNVEGMRTKSVLIGTEAGICAGLLLIAGLLGTSLYQIMRIDKGFAAEHLLAADVVIPTHRYDKIAKRSQFGKQIVERVVAIPGVVSAGTTSVLPLRGNDDVGIMTRPDDHRPAMERPLGSVSYISPGYLETLGVPILRGRTITEADRGRKVAVISEHTAAKVFPGEDPVGKKYHAGDHSSRLVEVIGVAANVRSISLTEKPGIKVYEPSWTDGSSRLTILLRTAGAPESVASALRMTLNSIDPEMPVGDVRTMDEVVVASIANRRFQTTLIVGFAVVAICLCCLGVFGVVSYAVTQRTAEMGIRMALGAQPWQIQSMVIRQGLTPVLTGSALGIAAALAASRLLTSFLYDVSPADPRIATGAILGLVAVAVAACYLPAYRATRVSPASTLRAE